MEILDKYCYELDDIIHSIKNDKDLIIENKQYLSLINREEKTKYLSLKRKQLHKIFLDVCLKIVDDICQRHMFEYATEHNFKIIEAEINNTLILFYNKYKYDINPQYFDHIIYDMLGEEQYFKTIKCKKYSNSSYLYLNNNKSCNININAIINFIYELIVNK
jgi:hypothetical protein